MLPNFDGLEKARLLLERWHFGANAVLEAFMLIGAQRDGRALRSDEVAALRQPLQPAGLEWHSPRCAALQRHVAR